MPLPYRHHIFVCTNRRAEGDPKGCCAEKGSEQVRALFKAELDKRGLKGQVRANAAGCLDQCAFGVTVVVYPEAVWYARVRPEDVVEIVEEHILGGRPVERLRMPGTRAVAARGARLTTETVSDADQTTAAAPKTD
jgi:(2Fe-2S) ferredoxin